MKVHPAVKTALCLLVAGPLLSTKPAAAQIPSRGQSTAEVHLSDQHFDQTEYERAPSSSQLKALKCRHERTANAPIPVLPGMLQLHGLSCTPCFFAGFDSFADMQKQHDQAMSDTKLQGALKSGDAAEAALHPAKRYGSISTSIAMT